MQIANPVPPEFCVSFCALGACLIVFVCLFQPDVAQSSNSFFFLWSKGGVDAACTALVCRVLASHRCWLARLLRNHGGELRLLSLVF